MRLFLKLSLACSLLSACFVTDALDQSQPAKKKITTTPAKEKEPEASFPAPKTLGGGRLARRLSLDLHANLPSLNEVSALSKDKELEESSNLAALTPNRVPSSPTLIRLRDTYLANSESTRQLAYLHARAWQLNPRTLPDLQAFVDGGNTDLAAHFDADMQRHIIDEPLMMVRYVLAEKRPYSELFTAPYTIMHTDVIDAFDFSGSGTPWPSEPYQFVAYDSDRPAAGILAGIGLPAGYSSQGGILQHRAARMLQALGCLKTEDKDAHLFYSLSATELSSDLSTLSTTHKSCIGCHSHFEYAANVIKGVATGADLSAWTNYAAPPASSGFYAGSSTYEDLAGLGELVGQDNRTHRCAVERVASALYQRPPSALDTRAVSLALDQFYNYNLDFMSAVPALLSSGEYSYAPVSDKTRGDYLRSSSGVKFLRRQHWRGIAEQLLGNTQNLSFPEELDAGYDETFTAGYAIPTGSYWHYVDILARQLASAIVTQELTAGRLASTRHALTALPDGTAETATSAQVQQQIKELWQLLSAEDVNDTSTTLTSFITLWNDMAPANNAASVQKAWQTVLVGMLTHPSFLTY